MLKILRIRFCRNRNNHLKEIQANENAVVLYTTGTHGSEYLYNCIAQTEWLSKTILSNQNSGKKKISAELILLPVGLFYKQKIKRHLHSYIWKLPKKLRHLLFSLLSKDYLASYNASLKLEKKPGISDIEILNSHALYNQVYSGKNVRFSHGRISFSIKLFDEKFFKHGILWLKSIIQGCHLWFQCYDSNRFSPKKFLQLRYEEIHIGDLAASTFLRSHPQSGGSLHKSLALLSTLVSALYICELAKSIKLNNNAKNYVISPEPTYLHATYIRAFHKLGVSVMSQESYANRKIIISPKQKLSNPRFVSSFEIETYNETDLSANVTAYMNDRLFNADSILPYMYLGVNNNNQQEIYDIDNKIIDISDSGLKVILFLHCFYDAQYIYGLDGFDDLYHWTEFTIKTCLENSDINKVLIKPHPNVDLKNNTADKVALNKLINKYKINKKVTFMQKQSSLVTIAKKAKFFGITHHGSVAEEIVYLGQPVIASSHAPWNNNYPFVKVWQTVNQYEQLLLSLSAKIWAPPSETDRLWLFRYLQQYRISTTSNNEYSYTWQKMADYITGEKPIASAENYWLYSFILNELTPDTELFNHYLDIIFESTWRNP